MRNNIIILGMIFSNLISSCSSGQKKISDGKLNDEQLLIEYGIYYTPDSHMTKSDVVELIQKKYSDFEIVDSVPNPESVKGSQIVIKEIRNVKEDFLAPNLDMPRQFVFDVVAYKIEDIHAHATMGYQLAVADNIL